MTLSATSLGSTTSNTLNSSFTHTLTGSVAVGDKIVVISAADNNGTNGATSTTSPCTDSKGHVYAARTVGLNDPSNAAAGCTLYIWETTCLIAMTTSDTVTVSFNPTTTAKITSVWKVTAAVGARADYNNASAAGTNVTGTSNTITTASLNNGDCVIGATAMEYGQAITADADTTSGTWSAANTANVGTTTSGMAISSQSKVVTATATQTYNTAWTTSTDSIISWISFRERTLNTYTEPVDTLVAVRADVTNNEDGNTTVAVTADEVDSKWLLFSDAVTPTTGATVTGLTNGVSYDFRVAAINAVGQGPYSDIATTTPSGTAPEFVDTLITATTTLVDAQRSATTVDTLISVTTDVTDSVHGPIFSETFDSSAALARFLISRFRTQWDDEVNGSVGANTTYDGNDSTQGYGPALPGDIRVTSGKLVLESGMQNYGESFMLAEGLWDLTGTLEFDVTADANSEASNWLHVLDKPYPFVSYDGDNANGPKPYSGFGVQGKAPTAFIWTNYAQVTWYQNANPGTGDPGSAGPPSGVIVPGTQQHWVVSISGGKVYVVIDGTQALPQFSLPSGFTGPAWVQISQHNHASVKYTAVNTVTSSWDNLIYPQAGVARFAKVPDNSDGYRFGWNLQVVGGGTPVVHNTASLVKGTPGSAWLLFNTGTIGADSSSSTRFEYRLNGTTWHTGIVPQGYEASRSFSTIGPFANSIPVSTAEVVNGVNTVEIRVTADMGNQQYARYANVALVVLDGAGAPQTVTGSIGTIRVQGAAGPVIPGPRTVTASIATVRVQGVAGTVTVGPVSITASVATVRVQGVAGTIVTMPITVAGSVGIVRIQGTTGSVVLSPRLITAAINTVRVQGVAGTVVEGPLSVAGSQVSVRVQGVAGTVVLGPRSITASVATVRVQGVAGTVTVAGVVSVAGAQGIVRVTGSSGQLLSAGQIAGAVAQVRVQGVSGTLQGTSSITAPGSVGVVRVQGVAGTLSGVSKAIAGTVGAVRVIGVAGTVSSGAGGPIPGAVGIIRIVGTGSPAVGPLAVAGATAVVRVVGVAGTLSGGPVTVAGSVGTVKVVGVVGTCTAGIAPRFIPGAIGNIRVLGTGQPTVQGTIVIPAALLVVHVVGIAGRMRTVRPEEHPSAARITGVEGKPVLINSPSTQPIITATATATEPIITSDEDLIASTPRSDEEIITTYDPELPAIVQEEPPET